MRRARQQRVQESSRLIMLASKVALLVIVMWVARRSDPKSEERLAINHQIRQQLFREERISVPRSPHSAAHSRPAGPRVYYSTPHPLLDNTASHAASYPKAENNSGGSPMAAASPAPPVLLNLAITRAIMFQGLPTNSIKGQVSIRDVCKTFSMRIWAP